MAISDTTTIAETEESIQQTLVKSSVRMYGSAKDAYSNYYFSFLEMIISILS